MSDIAKEIIALRNRERDVQANYRALWQQIADLMFPRESQIDTTQTPGTDKMLKVYDSTAVLDSQDMASGLSAAIIPTGQKFFGLTVDDRDLAASDPVQRYLLLATEILHKEIFESNFMLQFNETLRSLVVFGTGNLFSEWDGAHGKLNYKDHDISVYQIREDAGGKVDTMLLTFTLTARQVVAEFAAEGLSDDILKNAEEPETEDKRFEFIQVVRPREKRNPQMADAGNMPWESLVVDVKEQQVVREEGFQEFPFAVARWMKTSSEQYGTGQGTQVLPDVKILQVVKKDLVECSNKWNNPPREAGPGVEGVINVTPGAINYVQEMGHIKALEQGMLGNFPITKEMLEFQQEIVHKAFFREIFVVLSDLTQRMTTVEIRERMREGLRRLASPVARLHAELMNPVIMRSVLLLIRNGRIPYPPDELQGAQFGIEYQGQLALALQDQHAQGFVRWADDAQRLEPVFPGIKDNVSADRAFRRLGRSYGVHLEDIATEDEVAAIRQARQEALEAQQAQEAAQAAAEGYKQTTGAPEEGSPAGELMATMKE